MFICIQLQWLKEKSHNQPALFGFSNSGPTMSKIWIPIKYKQYMFSLKQLKHSRMYGIAFFFSSFLKTILLSVFAYIHFVIWWIVVSVAIIPQVLISFSTLYQLKWDNTFSYSLGDSHGESSVLNIPVLVVMLINNKKLFREWEV